ncbi:MAG: pilus assembly protein PilM [bacterium]|nr:pilus assembly protein PilM [bacterium]
MRFNKYKSVIGIDFGTYAIKAVELESRGDGLYVKNVGSAYYTEKVIEDGEFLNVPLLTEFISNLWEDSKFESKEVAISWKSENEFTRVLTLPILPDKEIYEAVRLEISSRYDVDVDLVAFDYAILDKNENNQEMKILVAGIPKESASTVYNIFKELNLKLKVLEPEFICQINLLKPSEDSFILLNIGARTTMLYMSKGNLINVIRALRFGGDNATDVISSTLNVSFEEAERWKKERFEQEVGYSKIMVSDALLNNFLILLREINRSIDYFYQLTYTYPNRVVLDGGGSLVVGLREYINRELGLLVDLLSLNSIVKNSEDIPDPNLYSIALGAALSGIGYKCLYKFFDNLEFGRISV